MSELYWKEVKIVPPEGYEIDKENSTFYENVWFNNNKERIKFLDNLIIIYKNKRTTIKTLIKQFIKTYEKRN